MSEKYLNLFAKRGGLRLVAGEDVGNDPVVGDAWVQMGLFPRSEKRLASFFHFDYFSCFDFIDVVEAIRPTFIFDVRVIPSFRMLNVERRRAMERLDALGSYYIDVPGVVGPKDYRLFRQDTFSLLQLLATTMASPPRHTSSLMIICDDLTGMDCYARDFNSVVSKGSEEYQVEVFVGGRPWRE